MDTDTKNLKKSQKVNLPLEVVQPLKALVIKRERRKLLEMSLEISLVIFLGVLSMAAISVGLFFIIVNPVFAIFMISLMALAALSWTVAVLIHWTTPFIESLELLNLLIYKYTLSKVVENDQECTLFTIHSEKKPIKEEIKSFYEIPRNIYSVLMAMRDATKSEIETLKSQHNGVLLQKKIEEGEKIISLLDKELSWGQGSIFDKRQRGATNRRMFEKLNNRLIENKKLLIKKALSKEDRVKLVENVRKAIAEIEETKAHQRQYSVPFPPEADSFIRFILCSFMKTNIHDIWIEDAHYYDLYFKYLPKETTDHYARLLKKKDPHTLKLMNDLLIAHPGSTDPINQIAHSMLADHFYVQFRDNKTEDITKQACIHVLKLDSNNEHYAEFKKTVIEAAFFFQEAHDTNLLSDEVQALVRYSHENPHAYEEIKKAIEERRVPSDPVLTNRTPTLFEDTKDTNRTPTLPNKLK